MVAKRNVTLSVIFRIVVCTVLLAVAVIIFAALVMTRPKPPAADLSTATPRVQVMQAQPVPVRRQWEGFGTAQAMDSANVPARVTAVVVERPAHIRAGQSVSQGEVLVQLDDSDFLRQVEIAQQSIADIDAQLARLQVEEQSWSQRAELAAAETQLAQAEYERIRQALERDAARQREVDQALRQLNTVRQAEVATREEFDKIAPRRAALQAQRQSQEASLRLAKLSAERTRITSPIDGVLQSVEVEVGENITAGQPVARVVNLARIEVPLLLPSAARPHIAPGDEVRLFEGSGNNLNIWNGRISRISPEDDQTTRTLRAFVEVTTPSDKGFPLAPGKFVQGVVTSGQPQQRWVVPRRAVDGQRILLIEDGHVRSRGVEVDFQIQADLPSLGLADRQWTVLKDSLPSNALVVVDASRVLVEGSEAVAIVQHAADASDANEGGVTPR